MKKRSRIHFGWIVVFAGSLVMAYTIGIAGTLRGLFLMPIANTFGYSASEISMSMTCLSVGSLISLFLANSVYHNISTKTGILVFGLILVFGQILTALSKSLLTFYIASFVIGFATGLGSVVPVSTMISAWFVKKRSLALGLTFSGSGIGSFIFAPVFSSMIASRGYVFTLFINAAIVLSLVLMAFILSCPNPKKKNIQPFGYDRSDSTENHLDTGLTFEQARKTSSFILILAGAFLVGFTLGPALGFLSPLITSAGYSPVFAGFMISMFSAAVVLGKIVYGFINDKLGSNKGNYYIFFLWALGLLSAYFIFVDKFMVALFTIILGFGSAIGTVSVPIWVGDLYGQKDYTVILPVVNICLSIGAAIGPMLVGGIVDTISSYPLGYASLGIIAAVSFVFINSAYKKRTHIQQSEIELNY